MENKQNLTKRDMLYNAVLETVKKHGEGMAIGLVRAVLAEVEGEIGMRAGRKDFSIIRSDLKRRESHECK